MRINKNDVIKYTIAIVALLSFITLTVYAQTSYNKQKPGLRKIHRIEIYKENGNNHAIIFARGIGKMPQKDQFSAKSKLMAKRAARLDGYRKLLAGINHTMTPRTGVTYIEGFLEGAALYDELENKESGVMEAYVTIFIDVHTDYIKAKNKEGILVEYIDKATYEQEKQKVRFIDKNDWQQWHNANHF